MRIAAVETRRYSWPWDPPLRVAWDPEPLTTRACAPSFAVFVDPPLRLVTPPAIVTMPAASSPDVVTDPPVMVVVPPVEVKTPNIWEPCVVIDWQGFAEYAKR